MELFGFTIPGWVGFVGLFITALLLLIQIFGRGFLKVREESAKADDRLINLLQGTVSELERKVAALETQSEANKTELVKLRTENEVMTKVLQGRDQATVEYQRAALDSIKKQDTIMTIVMSTNSNVEKLIRAMEGHMKTLAIEVTK